MSSGDSSSWSSTRTAAKGEKKVVYVCVEQFSVSARRRAEQFTEHCNDDKDNTREDARVWYAIDNSDDDSLEKGTTRTTGGDDDDEKVVEPLPLDPVFKSPCDSPHFFGGFAAFESFIYLFGGQYSKPFRVRIPSSDVYYIDTRNPQDGWNRGPKLKIPRDSPYGVVYNGKICVLGGLSNDRNPSIYAESFQPGSDHKWWRMEMSLGPLGLPKGDEPPTYMTGHAIYSDKLFVHEVYSKSLYCYDFNDDTWSTVVRDGFDWEFPCASIDEMMYFVGGQRFMGFDLKQHQWYKVVGLEMRGMLPPFFDTVSCFGVPSSLLHLGNGTLCLIWLMVRSLAHSDIFCTTFTVCKQYDVTEGCIIIKANVKSFKVYRIQGGLMEAGVAVDAGEGTDDEKEEGKTEVQGNSVVVTKQSEEGSARDDRKLPTTKKNRKKIKKRSSERLGTAKTKV